MRVLGHALDWIWMRVTWDCESRVLDLHPERQGRRPTCSALQRRWSRLFTGSSSSSTQTSKKSCSSSTSCWTILANPSCSVLRDHTHTEEKKAEVEAKRKQVVDGDGSMWVDELNCHRTYVQINAQKSKNRPSQPANFLV